ncbi:MAG: hypothetical protein OQK82_01515, partial [Candidatus Pacearchaeota archaeon]|nr:hypothetical protein [Candidatus Pacearchaeota archaeon]
LLIILLCLPLISSVEINMQDSFNQKETITASFSGTFLNTLTKDNIVFYREHIRIPIDFELLRVEDFYYIYALNDKSSGNYSFSLEDIEYYKQGEIVDEPVSKNFSINKEFADFSINPGFIKTIEDFEIELQNLQDKELIIDINSRSLADSNETSSGFFGSLFGNFFLSITGSAVYEINEQTSITLSPNEIKEIEFKVSDIPNATKELIVLSSQNTLYEFVLYIPQAVSAPKEISLNFKPSELIVSLEKGLTNEEIVILENVGNKILENITFELSNDLEEYIELSDTEIYDLEPNQSKEITLLFDSKNLNQTFQGELTARIPNETEDLVIIFELIGNNDTETSSISSKCVDLNGKLFESPDECDGEIRFANDGNCCLGEIKEPQKTNTGLIIGWLIIMTIIITLIWFFKFKYKKGKQEVNVLKFARKEKD